MQLCSINHGLNWIHDKKHCEFIQRLNIQRKNLVNLPIRELNVIKQNVKDFPSKIQNLYSKTFGHTRFPQHQEILVLSQRIVKKIECTCCPKKNWNSEEIIILYWMSKLFQNILNKQVRNFTIEDWNRISDFVPGRTGKQCMFRFLKATKAPLSQYPWTKQQSLILQQVIKSKVEQIDWSQVSEQLYFLSKYKQIYRTPKQCRQHWSTYCNSKNKKGSWKFEQDVVLLYNILNKGRKWSELCKYLSGRTQNAIKNRANLLLNKDFKKVKQSNKDERILFLLDRIKIHKKLDHNQINQLFLNKYFEEEKSEFFTIEDSNIFISQSFKQQGSCQPQQILYETYNNAAHNPIKSQLQFSSQNNPFSSQFQLYSPLIFQSPLKQNNPLFLETSPDFWNLQEYSFNKKLPTQDDLEVFCSI